MSWLDDAGCRGKPTWWWFPDRGPRSLETELALSICRTCPVRQRCLDAALELEESGSRVGIVGGLLAYQREQLARSSRQGA